MGETLGGSPVDPEHDAFADALPMSTSQGKVVAARDALGTHVWVKLHVCFPHVFIYSILILWSLL